MLAMVKGALTELARRQRPDTEHLQDDSGDAKCSVNFISRGDILRCT